MKTLSKLLIIILFSLSYSCSKEPVDVKYSSLTVETFVKDYGHIEGVSVHLIDITNDKYIASKTSNIYGKTIFENLKKGFYYVDCEYINIESQIDYITIINSLEINGVDDKSIEVNLEQ